MSPDNPNLNSWLTAELISLLPVLTGAELKILLALHYHWLDAGPNKPTSITYLMRLTGLARQTVIHATKALVDHGLVYKFTAGAGCTYAPKTDWVVQKLDSELRELRRESNEREGRPDFSLDSKSLSGLKMRPPSKWNSKKDGRQLAERTGLIAELRASGVFLANAQEIVELYTPDEIRARLLQYRYALEHDMAQGPGWLVTALREDWPEPSGYKDERNQFRVCPECSAPWFRGDFLHHRDCSRFDDGKIDAP